MVTNEAPLASGGRTTVKRPGATVLLPAGVVAIGPRHPQIGVLQLARAERGEARGIQFTRTLCGLPIQSAWDVLDIGARSVCRDCLAAVEGGR